MQTQCGRLCLRWGCVLKTKLEWPHAGRKSVLLIHVSWETFVFLFSPAGPLGYPSVLRLTSDRAAPLSVSKPSGRHCVTLPGRSKEVLASKYLVVTSVVFFYFNSQGPAPKHKQNDNTYKGDIWVTSILCATFIQRGELISHAWQRWWVLTLCTSALSWRLTTGLGWPPAWPCSLETLPVVGPPYVFPWGVAAVRAADNSSKWPLSCTQFRGWMRQGRKREHVQYCRSTESCFTLQK